MVATRTTETTDRALSASFQQSRTRVFARGGMVATGHPLATAAGLDALRRGGNAMDAAIAAALTTGVVIPAMSGLGGDAFFIHSNGKTGNSPHSTALASRRVPSRVTTSWPASTRTCRSMGRTAPGIPGAVDAYFYAINHLCNLPASDLFSYALHYAEHGFPLSDTGSRTIAGLA